MLVTQRGKYWHYRFQLDSRLYRGSTKQTTKNKAQQFMNALMTKLREGTITPAMVTGDVPLLCDLSVGFMKYVRDKHKAGGYTDNGLKHYERGVKMLQKTPVWQMRIDRIRSEDMEVVPFKGPASAFHREVGNDIQTANFVGHADTRTTRRYVHHEEDTGAIMDRHNRGLKLVKKKGAA